MKKIVKLAGIDLSKEEMYSKKLLRAGIKLNTPPVCNWACPYCYASSPELQKNLKEEDYIRYKDANWHLKMFKWVKELKKVGLKAITINGMFEPLTSPKLKEVINFVYEENLAITLVTNGVLLTDELIEFLKSKKVSILTKLNVPIVEKDFPLYNDVIEIQKQMTGLKGNAEKIYEDQKNMIKKLIAYGFNKCENPDTSYLGIETVICKLNINYIPELIRQCRELNIYSHAEVIKLQGYAKNFEEYQLTDLELKKLFEEVQERDIKEGYEFWEAKPPYIGGTCYQNLMRIDLHDNGDIYPCPGIDLKLGNLEEESILSILNNKNLQVIRQLEDLIEGDCKTCEQFKNRSCYGGCRGTVFQTLKNKGYGTYEALVGSDPSCWRVKKILDK